MRVAFIERLLGGGDDVGGSGEIGLADFEMDHVPALALKFPGAHQHFEGGFHANAIHSLC